jgi:hypothetical protein
MINNVMPGFSCKSTVNDMIFWIFLDLNDMILPNLDHLAEMEARDPQSHSKITSNQR